MRLRTLILILTSILVADTTRFGTARGGDESEMLVGFDFLVAINQWVPFSTNETCQRRLLDVRPRAEYDAGHIEGATWVDVKQARAIASRPGGLTDRDAWFDWLAPLGIHNRSVVRIISDDRQLEAARIWWLLRYLGVQNVGLVNGNFSLWKAQRRPVTQIVEEIKPITFPVDFQTDRLATREDVFSALKEKDARIVDARTAEEWTGKELRAKRGGHIPDACRLEWVNLVDNDGRFLSLDKLKARIKAAGIKPGEPVIAHCQSGGRASVDAFVFEMLGYPTRNYYLSWSDWGNADDTPITTDEKLAEPLQAPTAAEPSPKPFMVEYYYKCKWGHADEFLALFERNHLPVLRERIKGGDILRVGMTKPRIHTGEADRWDYRVTIEFRDAASAFNPALDEPIKQRLFPDQVKYRAEEQRRFSILEAHTDLPIDAVDLDKPVTSP